MKTEEEIRNQAKSVLKRSFRNFENGHKILAERNEARYDALCWVLGILNTYEDDALWEEAQKEYEEAKEGEEDEGLDTEDQRQCTLDRSRL